MKLIFCVSLWQRWQHHTGSDNKGIIIVTAILTLVKGVNAHVAYSSRHVQKKLFLKTRPKVNDIFKKKKRKCVKERC